MTIESDHYRVVYNAIKAGRVSFADLQHYTRLKPEVITEILRIWIQDRALCTTQVPVGNDFRTVYVPVSSNWRSLGSRLDE